MQNRALRRTADRIEGNRNSFSRALLLLVPFCFRLVGSVPEVAFQPANCMRSFQLLGRAIRAQTVQKAPLSLARVTVRHPRGLAAIFQPPSRLFATIADFERLEEGDMDLSRYTPYERWVRRLYQTNMFNPVKLGLQNMNDLHEAMGRPMDKRPVIHIAGTNGKGSVALKIATTLQLANPTLKVGLFCSPHVSSFRERMQINGEMIPEEKVVEYLPELYRTCEKEDIPATFFEITTALAFKYFQDADVVVLETGLGGRLDATNVIAAPAVSIITSIGLEHTRILGDTVEEIALEKGGIIKKDRPILVGPHCPHSVLRNCASEKGASQYLTCDDVLGEASEEIIDYDEENARIAQAALSILKEDYPELVESLTSEFLEQGTSVRPPCRFEKVELDNEVTVVLDVAHNPPAMEYLLRKLQATYPNRQYRIVVGMSSDKDVGLIGKMLLGLVDSKSLHLVQAYHPRAATLEAIVAAEPRLQSSNWDSEDRSISKQIKSALELAETSGEVLVVCGSVFLMAEAREALGFDEPRDSSYIAEVAGAHMKHGQEVFANTDPEPGVKEAGSAM